MLIENTGCRGVKDLDFRLRRKYLPACMVYNNGSWSAVAYEDAQYVFYGLTEAPGVCGSTVCNDFGVSMASVTLQGVHCTAVYVRIDQYVVTRSKAVLAVMTRHFNGLYSSVLLDQPTNPAALFRDRFPERGPREPLTAERAHALGYPKITAARHIHFTVKEAVAAFPHDRRQRLRHALAVPADATATMAASVCLWVASLDDELYSLVSQSGIFKCATVKESLKVGKEISVEAKSLQNLLDFDLRQVFEVNVLVNPIDGEVDWAEEKLHRTEPNVTCLSYKTVFEGAAKIFSQAVMVGRGPGSMTWESYWASRWQWSAAGSVHSQHPEDEKYVVRTDRNLKNKFIMISNMPNFSIEHFLQRQPEIHAWASTKYEWGKLRAIYGTDTTSYILAHFAFYNCENVLPNRFPVGKDANDANVTSRVGGVLANREPYCLDFQDFNSQHSVAAMRAVVDAFGTTFRNTLSPQQLAALEWTSESLERQVIHDNVGLKETYAAKGTLLSGFRLTTFLNSVLNAVYTDFMLGTAKHQGSSLHNGDDVLIGATSLEITRVSLQRGRRLNIRMQPAKCAFGAIAEFLRVDHRRGDKGQYLTRAVATVTHSRVESKMSTDARDLVESMENRFADCLNRGMSLKMIAVLRHLYYTHQAKVCDMSVHDMYKVKTTHRVAGGISEAIDADVDYKITPGVREHIGDRGASAPGCVRIRQGGVACTRYGG
ncbi:RNA-dependent RNA polymerase [Rhodosporidiobolus odoratus RNA virus 1]|nr:RNA-dependent RNA polymerase [Rhodosporidiobolus odoratus RNA virus 1]